MRLLAQQEIMATLRTRSWTTARRRLKALGIIPVKAGSLRLVSERQLVEAVEGSPRHEAPEPDWGAIAKAAK